MCIRDSSLPSGANLGGEDLHRLVERGCALRRVLVLEAGLERFQTVADLATHLQVAEGNLEFPGGIGHQPGGTPLRNCASGRHHGESEKDSRRTLNIHRYCSL